MTSLARRLHPLFLAVLLAGCAGEDAATSDESDFTAVTPLGPTPSGKPTKLPIILAHGFNASPTNYWGFRGVAEALKKDGHKVIVASVPPYDGPEVRAEHLATYVDEALAGGAKKVNIIAHSMGGLDSRYLISSLGYGDRVASLTTISTPHRGSAVADVALGLVKFLGPADDAIDALATLWGLTFSDVAENSDVSAALSALAESSAPAFNAENPDDKRVFYQSWAGVSSLFGIRGPRDKSTCGVILGGDGKADRMDGLLAGGAPFVAHGVELRPNDGMATVESAKWGKFQGCIPADHLDEVGQVKDSGMDSRTGFDHVRFYRNVAFGLSAKGF